MWSVQVHHGVSISFCKCFVKISVSILFISSETIYQQDAVEMNIRYHMIYLVKKVSYSYTENLQTCIDLKTDLKFF